jgi:glycosyltransferase involved in cell wall biosynthesis
MNQTYSKLEILIINDCSPDNSEEIIKSYLTIDSRIKYIKNDLNLGLGETRNIGINAATGAYILFVDSDDSIETNTVEDSVNLLKKYAADLVEFGFQISYRDKVKVPLSKQQDYNVRAHKVILDKRIRTLDRRIDHIACNKLFSLKLIRDNNIYFRNKIYEDTAFTREYLFNCKLAVISESVYYHYYVNQGSITKSEFSLEKIGFLIQGVNNIFSVLEKYKLSGVLGRRYLWLFRRDIARLYLNTDRTVFSAFLGMIGSHEILHRHLYSSLKLDLVYLRFCRKRDGLLSLYSSLVMLFHKIIAITERFSLKWS